MADEEMVSIVEDRDTAKEDPFWHANMDYPPGALGSQPPPSVSSTAAAYSAPALPGAEHQQQHYQHYHHHAHAQQQQQQQQTQHNLELQSEQHGELDGDCQHAQASTTAQAPSAPQSYSQPSYHQQQHYTPLGYAQGFHDQRLPPNYLHAAPPHPSSNQPQHPNDLQPNANDASNDGRNGMPVEALHFRPSPAYQTLGLPAASHLGPNAGGSAAYNGHRAELLGHPLCERPSIGTLQRRVSAHQNTNAQFVPGPGPGPDQPLCRRCATCGSPSGDKIKYGTSKDLPGRGELDLDEGADGASLHKFWHRAGWLVLLLMCQSSSSIILEHFELLIKTHPVVIYFLTMLVGAGGNAGGQSTVLVVRRLALLAARGLKGERISIREIVGAEMWVGGRLALVLFGASFVRCVAFQVRFIESVAICLSMLAIVFTSTVVGAALPVLLSRLGMDPAHAGATIQVIMDVSGVTLTCIVSCLVLGLPVSGGPLAPSHNATTPLLQNVEPGALNSFGSASAPSPGDPNGGLPYDES